MMMRPPAPYLPSLGTQSSDRTPETPSVWSRTPASAGAARRGSALLLHAMLVDRRTFDRPKGQGLAATLANLRGDYAGANRHLEELARDGLLQLAADGPAAQVGEIREQAALLAVVQGWRARGLALHLHAVGPTQPVAGAVPPEIALTVRFVRSSGATINCPSGGAVSVTIIAPECSLADGLATAQIALVLADPSGNPAPGHTVVIEATGFANTLTQPPTTEATPPTSLAFFQYMPNANGVKRPTSSSVQANVEYRQPTSWMS